MGKLSVLFALWASTTIAQPLIPSGTELHVRLKTAVLSNAAKAGSLVEAVTITPVLQGERILLPAGIPVKGRVVDALPWSKPDERARVQMVFTEFGDAASKATVVDVDNARESVDDTGKIFGILASETLAARIDQGIGKVAERNEALGGLLEAAKSVLMAGTPTGEIKYEPGVELTLRLVEPLVWKGPLPREPQLKRVADEKELASLVNSQPFQTMAASPRRPSDLTNLMFVGADESLRRAFEQAGWSIAHDKNPESILETVRAIAEVRGYKEAPMSILLLDGRRSDYDLQKQNNTFAKRHHLRVWRRPGTYNGKAVWVSAATHDIGIDFSQENSTFIHIIDSEIDRERAKVVSDLLFTGLVESLALVERPDVPKKSRNATGDAIRTDGRMAVVVLK
jgi:hypothetical protein